MDATVRYFVRQRKDRAVSWAQEFITGLVGSMRIPATRLPDARALLGKHWVLWWRVVPIGHIALPSPQDNSVVTIIIEVE